MPDPRLTHSDTERRLIAGIVPGMAYFAGTGPDGKACGSCRDFKRKVVQPSGSAVEAARAAGLPLPDPKPTGEGWCERVPRPRKQISACNAACKYWETA